MTTISIMQANGVNRLVSYSGATPQAGCDSPEVAPNVEDKRTGELLDQRVATLAAKLKQ